MRRLPLQQSGSVLSTVVDPSSTDIALIAASATDANTFGFLVDRYFDDIFRFCYYRTGDWHDAEDLTSQVFIIAFTNLRNFTNQGEADSFRRWLLGIARNKVGQSYRLAKSHPTTSLDLAIGYAGPEDSVETMVIETERRDALASSLAQLPASQREVVELRLAGFSAGQIAEQMNRSPEAIRQMQSRALKTLRQLLEPERALTSEVKRG